MICIHKIKKAICRFLLPIVSRWENKLWRELYVKPRKYCSCITDKEFVEAIKSQSPNPDMFSNCVIRDDNCFNEKDDK